MVTPGGRAMSPLDRKLLRDLWRIKGQAVAIALVIALGVLMLVMMDGLVNSLEQTKEAYYERYRLADVFAPVKRAPGPCSGRDRCDPRRRRGRGPGQGRRADRPCRGSTVPVRAQAVSLPDFRPPRLNDVYLTDGRRLDPDPRGRDPAAARASPRRTACARRHAVARP